MSGENRLIVAISDINTATRLVTRVELNGYKERCVEALSKALELEQFPLFPGDVKDFDSARTKWLAHYRAQWHRYPRECRSMPMPSNPYTIEEEAWEETDNGFDDELTVMAEVRAYFQVAHKVSISCCALAVISPNHPTTAHHPFYPHDD
jgi:hypothetical protein